MHPIIDCAADVRAALKGVASVEPAFMAPGEKQSALVALTAARSQLDALTARVLAASGDVGEAHGLRDDAAWLAVQTRTTRREARRDLSLGRSLEQHPDVAAALTSGEVRTEQARVIAEAVDALPHRVDADVRGLAEETLLELAARHDARELKRIGKRILDVVAPEVGESHEEAVLAAEESRAVAGVELTLVDDGEGRCHGRFTVPSHVGAMLKRHLLALANPARHAEAELRDDAGDWKPLRRRLGEAFIEYVERYPAEATPQTAGVNATVVVTMTLEQLLAQHATSQPLDLGRAARLFTKAQRIALGLRDGGCTATAARPAPPGATPTTTTPGRASGSPTSPTAGCCAPGTTAWPTTPATPRPSTPTTGSPSPCGRRSRALTWGGLLRRPRRARGVRGNPRLVGWHTPARLTPIGRTR